MTTKRSTRSHRRSPIEDLTAAEILPLLADDRRRHVLHVLAFHDRAVPLAELAWLIARAEDRPTGDHCRRVLTTLYHNHLPKLVDSEVVAYDTDRETVTATDAIDRVRPYLDLALVDDAR